MKNDFILCLLYYIFEGWTFTWNWIKFERLVKKLIDLKWLNKKYIQDLSGKQTLSLSLAHYKRLRFEIILWNRISIYGECGIRWMNVEYFSYQFQWYGNYGKPIFQPKWKTVREWNANGMWIGECIFSKRDSCNIASVIFIQPDQSQNAQYRIGSHTNNKWSGICSCNC